MQYRGRNLTLRSLYAGHTSKKGYFDSVCCILYTLQNICSLGILFQIQEDVKLIEKMTNVYLVYNYLEYAGTSPLWNAMLTSSVNNRFSYLMSLIPILNLEHPHAAHFICASL